MTCPFLVPVGDPSCAGGGDCSRCRMAAGGDDMADVQFNPMDPEFVADPYPMYRRLQADDPVHHSPPGLWGPPPPPRRARRPRALVPHPPRRRERGPGGPAADQGADRRVRGRPLRHAGAARPRPLHARPGPAPGHPAAAAGGEGCAPAAAAGLLATAFPPKARERLRPDSQRIVDRLLDAVDGHGEMDLIDEFAYPLPVNVICDMLGVPAEGHER